MAIVDLTPVLLAQSQAFDTAPEPQLLKSFRPIGLQWFSTQTTIVAKGAGDETHIRATLILPSQYVYCFKSLNVAIKLTLGTTHNFTPDGMVTLSGHGTTPNPGTLFYPCHNKGISYEFVSAVAADPTRLYVLDAPIPMILPGGAGLQLSFADEAAGATNVGLLVAVVCFYKYVIEQGLSSELNTAPPVLLVN